MTARLTQWLHVRRQAVIVRVQHDVQRHGLRMVDAWLVHPWRTDLSLIITMACTLLVVCVALAGFVLSLQVIWTIAFPWLATWFDSQSEKQFLFTLGLMASCFCLVTGWKLMIRAIEWVLNGLDPHYNQALEAVMQSPEAQDPLLYQRCKSLWPILAAHISRAEWRLAKHFWNQQRYLAANAHYLARRLPAIQANSGDGLKKPRM